MELIDLVKERCQLLEDGSLIPENTAGLKDYSFVMQPTGTIMVYHRTECKIPVRGIPKKSWLSCSEGWRLKDGKWHETIRCGWKSDRVVDTLEDVFDCYRVR